MTLNDLLIVVAIGVVLLIALFVGWVIRDLKAYADAEYTADLEERLADFEDDNVPERDPKTGRFVPRD